MVDIPLAKANGKPASTEILNEIMLKTMETIT